MERPKVEALSTTRNITGEILYLDEMRRQNESPKPYAELSDSAIQMYEAEADAYTADNRPAIMEEYERYDTSLSETLASCMALTDELLKLKESDSSLTFIDIAIATSP